jgi:hypothetical protein
VLEFSRTHRNVLVSEYWEPNPRVVRFGEKMNHSQRDLVPTALPNHFTFKAPPPGFNPLRASDDDLRQFGLPHRPDARRHPAAARMWIRAMSRVKKFVTPSLSVKPKVIHGPGPQEYLRNLRKRPRTVADNVIVENDNSTIWSGLVVSGTEAGTTSYSQVWGTWVIPWVTVPPGGADNFVSSLWVGLNDTNVTSLLQAGTEQDATLNTGFLGGLSTNYYAWVEWFPGPSLVVGQLSGEQPFPVGPGQVISVNIESFVMGGGSPLNPAPIVFGIISMLNVSTGVAITPILLPAPTLNFNNQQITAPPFPNQQAVWIFERPSFDEDGQPVPGALAEFGNAVMVSGGAVGSNVNEGKGSAVSVIVGENDGGQLLNMVAADGNTLCEASESPELIFTYVGSD